MKTVSLDDIQDETGTEDQSMSRKEFLLFLEQYLNPRECQILLCITLKEKSMKELAQIQGVTLYCLRRDLEKAKLRLQYALKERMVVKR